MTPAPPGAAAAELALAELLEVLALLPHAKRSEKAPRLRASFASFSRLARSYSRLTASPAQLPSAASGA